MSVTSATVIVVSGNASSEDSGDTFTINSEGIFQCPDDFGGMDGDMRFDEDDETSSSRVRHIHEGQLRRMRAETDSSARPKYVAVEPKAPTSTGVHRLQWVFFAVPNDDYTLTYKKVILSDAFDATISAGCRTPRHCGRVAAQ